MSIAADTAVDGVIAIQVVQQAETQWGKSADASSRDGWVVLSRCVDKDGTAADPIVVASSDPALDAPARQTVRDSKYQPATLDGTAIDSCDGQVPMRFQAEGADQGPRPEFLLAAGTAQELVKEGKVADASLLIDTLAPRNPNEALRLAILRADAARAQGDMESELRWLNSVLESPDNVAELTATLRRKVFVLQVQLQQYGAALANFEALHALDGAKMSEPELKAGEQLRALRDATAPVATPGKLDGQFADDEQPAMWSAPLLRRELAFVSGEGAPERFELRCDHKHYRSPFSDESQWKLPPSWGACTLFVFGPADAAFKLVEFTPEAPAPN